MSSAPQHEENMETLKEMGLIVDAHSEDYYESWNYDSLVDIVVELIPMIKKLQEENEALEVELFDKLTIEAIRCRGPHWDYATWVNNKISKVKDNT